MQRWQKSFMRKLLAEIALKIYILLSEGELEMMAMLFSQRVILGKCEFEQVPKKLQKQVAEILINRIENAAASIRQILLSTRIIERESTAKKRKGGGA